MWDTFMYHLKRGLPFIITIILLLVIPAVMFLRKNRFSFFDNNFHRGKFLQEQQDKIHDADSLKSIDNKTNIRGEIKQNSSVKSDKKENPEFIKDIKGTYHIIVGSFANNENAKQASENYLRRGFKTSIISDTDKNGVVIKLVSVKTFNNFMQAANYLKEFKEKTDPAAWIYSNH